MTKPKKHKDGASHNAHAGNPTDNFATTETGHTHVMPVEDKRKEAREIHTNGSTPSSRR